MSASTHSQTFIQAIGTRLTLDDRPFRVAGANNYYLGYAPDAMVEPVFDLASRMGLNTLRTWAFLDCGIAVPGSVPANASNGIFFQYQNAQTGTLEWNDGPDGLERLDRTIFLAEQWGIHLIMPLVNYWDDFGGVNQYLQWFGLSGRDQFYVHPDVKDAYRNYVEHLLLRVNTRTGRQYRDEPAILAWELANEPRCINRDNLSETLPVWADEMSRFIRSVDPNHLIGVGDEGFFRRKWKFGGSPYNGSVGVDCERLLAIPSIDFGTCHLYPSYTPEMPADVFGARWIQQHIEAADTIGKPMLIEEYGVRRDFEPTAREAIYGAWLKQISESNGSGALLWMIAAGMPNGDLYRDYDGYTIYSAEEVPSLIAFARDS